MSSELEQELDKIKPVLTNDYQKKRTVGVGVLNYQQAYELGAAGPQLRGSGVAQDVRMTGYGAYKYIDFEPVVETAGDSYARTMVRLSRDLSGHRHCPSADRQAARWRNRGQGQGQTRRAKLSAVPSSRGEVLYYVKASGKKYLDRVRIRTPTFANVPPLLAMLPGCEMADVPVIALSIDPCISCTER